MTLKLQIIVCCTAVDRFGSIGVEITCASWSVHRDVQGHCQGHCQGHLGIF